MYKVTHYDDSITEHETFEAAEKEAAARLEPWREGDDKVRRQDWMPSKENGTYIFVATPYGEPTDAESYVELV